MCNCCTFMTVLFGIVAIVVGVGFYIFMPTMITYSDLDKYPYVYGSSICSAFENKEISVGSLSLFNFLNYKNVFYGDYNNVNVVVKKLASQQELSAFDNLVCSENNLSDSCNLELVQDKQNYTQKIMKDMLEDNCLYKNFKVCSKGAAEMLFDYFLQAKPVHLEEDDYLKNVWTILKVNVEPLILQILESDKMWPLPKYYGSCGRLSVVENRGSTLLQKSDLPWMERAYLTLQLLYGAKNFTFDHPHLRFYLTDVSPDNIVVDDALKLTFADLENLVVFHEKKSADHTQHRSEVIHDSSGFAYSEYDLCHHSVSDHNYYAICKLLLSRNAPYPMMRNGLLHTPPVNVAYNYKELFHLIEECSDSSNKTDRFQSANKIMDILDKILSDDDLSKNSTTIQQNIINK